MAVPFGTQSISSAQWLADRQAGRRGWDAYEVGEYMYDQARARLAKGRMLEQDVPSFAAETRSSPSYAALVESQLQEQGGSEGPMEASSQAISYERMTAMALESEQIAARPRTASFDLGGSEEEVAAAYAAAGSWNVDFASQLTEPEHMPSLADKEYERLQSEKTGTEGMNASNSAFLGGIIGSDVGGGSTGALGGALGGMALGPVGAIAAGALGGRLDKIINPSLAFQGDQQRTGLTMAAPGDNPSNLASLVNSMGSMARSGLRTQSIGVASRTGRI